MIAYIPARIGSKRIPKKNIKELGGKPLITHVIEKLLNVKGLTGIAVSTDSVEVRDIVTTYEKVETLELRNAELSNDESSFMDLVYDDIPRFCDHFNSRDILFTLATSALVPVDSYEEGIKTFMSNKKSLVMTVNEYLQSPMLALSTNDNGELSPLFPDQYLLPTKELKRCYSDSGNFYCFNLDALNGKKMLLDLNPILPVILPRNVGIDVDTMEDWNYLEKQFEALSSS